MTQKIVMKLATRGQRFGAAMIDKIPQWIFTGIFMSRAAVRMAYAFLNEVSYAYYGVAYGTPAKPSPMWTVLALIYLAVELFFFSRGQSIGKAIVGLRVVEDRTGKPLGFWWMLFREFFVKPAGASMFLLGYIWIFVDNQNRCWQDKILDTYVIDALAGVISERGVTETQLEAVATDEQAVEDVAVAPETVTEPVTDVIEGYDPSRYETVVKHAGEN
ncbi:MAG: RDD family protein [Mogibacterium sp.]|nr:RDD family protein [Mogibacterium sp.]